MVAIENEEWKKYVDDDDTDRNGCYLLREYISVNSQFCLCFFFSCVKTISKVNNEFYPFFMGLYNTINHNGPIMLWLMRPILLLNTSK